MMDSVSTSFSRDEDGVSSITFNHVSRDEMQWGSCSLTLSANGKLIVGINNYFLDPSVVFGQLSMIAKAMSVETTSLILSLKSMPVMDQHELASSLAAMVCDLSDLVNQVEHYFIQAAQLHFGWETKQCMVKNRHVCVKGSVGSFSIPFTMLIEIIADAQPKPVQSALVSHSR